MKKLTLAILITMALSSCCGTNKSDTAANAPQTANFGLSAEQMTALLRPVELYIESGIKGNSEAARKAFAPLATISHMEGDTLITLPIQALYDYYDTTGAQECSYELTACSVANDVAMIRIESVFGQARFTDMFTLLKVGSEWQIVSKVFTVK